MRTQYRIMVDASAFLDDLRLYVRRLSESIVQMGAFATDQEIWVTAQLQNLIWEIEDGYATLVSTWKVPQRTAPPEAGLGTPEPEHHAQRPGNGG